MLGVLYLLSQVLGVFALAMLAPAFVALLAEDTGDAEAFLLVSGLTGFLSGAMFFALRGRRWRLGRAGACGFVLGIFLMPSLIGAVPLLMIVDIDPIRALFESVSGFTTTGATILPSVEAVGPAAVFWRAEMQWLGGLATLVALGTILGPTGIGGLTARNIAILGPAGEGGLQRSFATARSILVLYAGMTVLCVMLLVFVGIPAFDAVCIGFATVSTGGFMPIDGGLASYANPAAELVIAIFMLAGATSIVWHRMLLQGRRALLAAHRESYYVIGLALLAGFLFSVQLADLLEMSRPVDALRYGLFAGISIVTTSGFESWPHVFDFLPLGIAMGLAVIGGGTMSTAGGLKLYRIGAMFVQSMHELKRLVYPHSVRSTRFGSQSYDTTLMKGVWASTAGGLAVLSLLAILLSLDLPSFDASALAATAAFANIGPIYPGISGGEILPPYGELSPLSLLVLMAGMIIGRVEIIALLGLASVAYWRS
jgi:trk system potassium uptake protein TrkH